MDSRKARAICENFRHGLHFCVVVQELRIRQYLRWNAATSFELDYHVHVQGGILVTGGVGFEGHNLCGCLFGCPEGDSAMTRFLFLSSPENWTSATLQCHIYVTCVLHVIFTQICTLVDGSQSNTGLT